MGVVAIWLQVISVRNELGYVALMNFRFLTDDKNGTANPAIEIAFESDEDTVDIGGLRLKACARERKPLPLQWYCMSVMVAQTNATRQSV